MVRRFGAAALASLAIVLAGGIGHAAAQSTQGSTNQKFNLNQGQAQSVTSGLHNEQTQSNQSGYQAQLGTKVPDSMAAQQIPDDVTTQVPEIKGYYFVKLPDRVLLLDPDTKTVVEIVPASETSGAGPGANDSQSGGGSPNR